MPPLPQEIISILSSFAPLFSARVWPQAQTLLVGALLAPGKRTVSAVLEVVGLSQQLTFQRYPRVLNRCVWSPLAGSRVLLEMLVAALVPPGRLVLALDDTIERRWGAQITARGIYRDPVRSSGSHWVKTSGLRWLSLMLVAPLPWTARAWALPFLSVLCPSEGYYHQRQRTPRTLLQRGQTLLKLVARWLPKRSMVVVADSRFSALAFLDAVRTHVAVITRLRLDAALYDPPPPRTAHTLGRPRGKGARQPPLQQRLNDPTTPWQPLTVDDWYGTGSYPVEIYSQTALWYHTGLPVVPLRFVLIRDPKGRFAPQALLTTDATLSPRQMLTYFRQRWAVETTFEQARAHLGMETQRQWNDQAIARTTPVILALVSLVALSAHRLGQKQPRPGHTTAWYPKPKPTFADALAWVRQRLWQTFYTSANQHDLMKIPKTLFNRLIHTVSYAT